MKNDGLIKKITEDTLIPLGSVLVIIGFVYWLSGIYHQSNANAKAIEAVEVKQNQYDDNMLELKYDIGLIKGAMGIKGEYRAKQTK